MALRVHPPGPSAPAELGLPNAVTEVCWLPEGLVIVAGSSGSGRSTTLAALVAWIREHRAVRTASIGPLGEIATPAEGWPLSQRAVPEHVPSVSDGLRFAMREGAGVLAVEEIAEHDTLLACLEAAEAGHLVIGSMRAPSARMALEVALSLAERRLGAGPARSLLASSLRAVLAQRLCRSTRGERVAACEILFATPELAAVLGRGHLEELGAMLSANRELGMQSLNDHLVELVGMGVLAPEEAYLCSYDRSELGARLERLAGTSRAGDG